MDTSLTTFSHELAALVERAAPSVVAIHGRRHMPSSGVHWRQGYLVTAEHTLRRDEDITITTGNGDEVKARLVGRDPGTDLALLSAEGLGQPIAGEQGSGQTRVGDIALVIGRSPNSGPNASMGIISAVSGPWRTWRGGQLDQYIRLDATVFPGSSGGAIVDYAGRVIGIASSALSRVAGLAIPSSTVNRVVRLLLKKGSVPRGYLGVGVHTVPLPESFRRKFKVDAESVLMVLSVEEDGPAARSGILVGDMLLEIGGTVVGEAENLQSILEPEWVGKTLPARIIRGGEMKEVQLQIGERTRRRAS